MDDKGIFVDEDKQAGGVQGAGFSSLATIWNDRLNLEQQQAALRLIVGAVAFCYLLYAIVCDGMLSENDISTLTVATVFFGFAFAIIAWIIKVPGVSIARRVLGIVVDTGATTGALYFNGIYGMPLFVVYLWVTFGNGFRFGRKYLILSGACSVAGFAWVTLLTDYSGMDRHVTIGVFVGLIVLPLYVSSLLRQLTRSLEVAEKANQAKSNFLATMSHEIRTPLNGLVGITEMLAKTRLDERQNHYVQLISQSSEWLMRVITDGLDFSKIEAGEFLLMQDPFDLRATVEELCAFYRGVQETKDIEFAFHLSPDVPRIVIGDQLRLVQVLGNLLSNAGKFTEKGQISVRIELMSNTAESVRVQFTVADTGIGVEQKKQSLIFQPFHQAESGTTKKYGGTGLGLAIADRIVWLMGGKIKLSSAVGEGSTFTFSLVFPLPKEGEIQLRPPEKSKEQLQWRRRPILLLAEDHEINREVAVSQLEDMGCRVVVAVNGREALQWTRQQVFDLILMDCQMPELDGYTATREIRTDEARLGRNKVPVMALTAHVTVEDKRKCLACGMDDYLGKPFRTEDLRAKLKKWLKSLLLAGEVVDLSPPAALEVRGELPEHPVTQQERKVVHDLKNVLFTIQGSAELSIFQDSQAGSKKHAERILVAVQKAVALAEELSGLRLKK